LSAKAESVEVTAGRRPGRPRCAAAHQAILAATLQVLIDQGYAQMSMERVAERAGVGKATIYRRWRNKSELVAEALGNLRIEQAPPDEGSLRADVLELSKRQLGVMRAQPRFPRLAPLLLAESADDPELHAIVRANLLDPIRSMIAQLFKRAIERGEVRKDVDVERVIDLLHGPIIYRFLMSGADMSAVTENYTQSLLDILIPGLEPRRRRTRG
jgi:AcrR family transcriptional regulator